MINLSDLPELVGYLMGSFAVGYAASYLLYVLRRTLYSMSQ